MTKLSDYPLYFEEDGKQLFKKGQKKMSDKVTTKKPTTKTVKITLSIYTYINFKRFGLAVAVDEGIKITVLWFETHIKFEKR